MSDATQEPDLPSAEGPPAEGPYAESPPVEVAPEATPAAVAPTAVTSVFWRRIGAALIDSIILGCIGFVLGAFLFDTFAQLGGLGPGSRIHRGAASLRYTE